MEQVLITRRLEIQEPKDTFDAVVSALIAERGSPRKKSTKKTSRRSSKKRKGYAKPTKPQPETHEEFEIKIDSLYDDNATNADVRLREYMRGERSFIDRHGVESKFKPTEGRQYTLEEIGTIIGVTRERVRQIEETHCENVALHSIAEHARGSDRDRLANGIETE